MGSLNPRIWDGMVGVVGFFLNESLLVLAVVVVMGK